MTYGLRFVESMDGSLEGINDAGIETFAGKRLASLAREQAQNSLDARDPNAQGPVEVEYELQPIPKTELPGATDLAKAIDSALDYWSQPTRHHRKTIDILQRAKRTLARSTIEILRISDRNTTGLRDSDKVQEGDWYSLTKASGVSLKGEDALGSYGIGKNVFWLNSALRTVFFSTRDIEKKCAFQGVTKLVSHPIEVDGRSALSRSIGFYGVTKGFEPIRQRKEIPQRFRVTGTGTDIYVAGFEYPEDWEQGLITAFAKNFFVAFHQDLLRVRIGKHEISAATIAPIIEGLAAGDDDEYRALKDYFDCITSPEAREFTATLPHIGKTTLRLLLREGASKRIAMFRATGMMIYEQSRFRTPLEFAGVCICDDPEGNKFLRKLEPPSHDAWEPERGEERRKEAKDAIKELRAWLRTCVQELYPTSDHTTLDVPDLERYLPDEEDDEPLDHHPGEKEGDPRISEEKLLEGRIKRSRTRPGNGSDSGPGDDNGSDSGDENGGNGGDRGSKGGPTADEQEIALPLRIFMDPTSDDRYVVHGMFPQSGRYAIYLYAVGDDGRQDPIELIKPRLQNSQGRWTQASRKSPNAIGPFSIHQGGPIQLDFRIVGSTPLTLVSKVTKHGK